MMTALTPFAMDREPLPTFPEVLSHWATAVPHRRVYVYLRDGEDEEASLTFAELRAAVAAAAKELSALAKPGERVLLLYPSGLDFIVAFLACLCSGVVAVPVSVPNRRRGLEILAGLASDSGAVAILSVGDLLARYASDIDAATPPLAALPRIDTALWPRTSADTTLTRPQPSALALLQYTSGSTGAPRGVAVTHANLSANQQQLSSCFAPDQNSIIVSWLPMFHDMGLGSVLVALWTGAQCVLMSPTAFLQRPMRWLHAISKYRATYSVAPDFAFDLCARSASREETAQLDLSCWRGACSGSEPVRASTLQRFRSAFAAHGFRWESVHPLYGLAEATLFVTGEGLDTPPTIGRFSRTGLEQGQVRADDSAVAHSLVSCGRPWLAGSVLIVDSETRVECAPDRVGEIWVSGPQVAAGYWGKDVETLETFQAYTADGRGPFLRTGDLGFLRGGGLFVTGRSKDLIIVRGRNHYPQDIEHTVSMSHPSLEPQRCAAFSVETDDGEGLVVAQEVKRSALRNLDNDEVFRAIRNSVAEEHGLSASAIVLLRPLALPRTTSGKVRRKACREQFIEGTLGAVASSGFSVAQLNEPSETAIPVRQPISDSSRTTDRLVQWLKQQSWANQRRDPGRRSLAPDTVAALAGQGLLGMQVDSRHGGLQLGHSDTVRVLEQLGGVDLRASLFVGLNNYLGVWPILRHGQPRLQDELLPQLATGQRLAGFALAEPGSGINAQGWSSRVESANGSGWRLYGTKFLSGEAGETGPLNVFVRHAERRGISGFVVGRDAQGLGQAVNVTEHGVTHGALRLEGALVPSHRVLGRLGEGMDVAFDALRHSHLAIGAACLGGMKRCGQLIFQHATQRQSSDAGVVAHPVTMLRLGRINAEATALECLVRLLAEAADTGRQLPSEAFAVCKLIGPEMLWEAVDDLVQLLGRRGLVETLQMQSLVDDARVLRSLEGPTDAAAAALGASFISGGLHAARKLAAEFLSDGGLDSLVEEAVAALKEGGFAAVADLPPSSLHWMQARAGEFTSWVVLLGSVEHYRRQSPSAELNSAAAWVRSNLETTLTQARSGPPAEARGATAMARYASTATADEARARLVEAATKAPAIYPSPPRLSPESAREPEPHSGGDDDLARWIADWLSRRLRLEATTVDPRRSIADFGVDSLVVVELAKALSEKVGRTLDEALLWNFTSINALVAHLQSKPTARANASLPPTAAKLEYDASNFFYGSGDDLENLHALYNEWYRTEAFPQGYYLFSEPLSSAPAPLVKVTNRKTGQVRQLLNLASYNYLGISYRPEVMEAAVQAIYQYGLGASGSPILSGTFEIHRELERALARFKGKEAAVLFPTGYSANVGFISAIMRPGDTILLDQYSHASIVDGAILAKSKTVFFRHNDAEDLEQKLANVHGKKLVVVEGVYSMDGDLCPLPDIVRVAKRHNARILIDEAHSSFLFGANGRGVVEHFGLDDEVDFHLGTFSKTLGGQGGYVCGSADLTAYVDAFGRSRFFSCNLAPVIAAGLLAGLRIVEREPELRAKLWKNVAYLRRRMGEEGIDFGKSTSQVIPVMVNDDEKIFAVAEKVQERGLFLNPVIYPGVPKNRSRLRISVSAAHDEQQLETAVQTLAGVLSEEGIISR